MLVTTHTETAEGAIPHLRGDGFYMPVMLDFARPKMWGKQHYPLRRYGRLVYAVPGGTAMIGPAEVKRAA